MFKIHSQFEPSGDQPQAIEKLANNLNSGEKYQTLLGATGTGKTYTISKVIEKSSKPVLVLAHNKTLAGQLYSEFKSFFPDNAVEFFISYYDYYQPEAYVASRDLYIDKTSSINDDIDQMRHSAASALIERDDVIIVSSVSCIYNMGNADDYAKNRITFREGQEISRGELCKKLVGALYDRNDHDFKRGTFRVRGEVVELIPAGFKNEAYRIEFFGDEIESISQIDTLNFNVITRHKNITIAPASLFVTDNDRLEKAIERIENELKERVEYYKSQGMFVEAERIKSRTEYDVEMLRETGFCSGVENYSCHLALREEGATPETLIDFYKKNFLLIVDESHATLPQVRGMYNGDRQRKSSLVEHGFRLPTALDNRPLNFKEFEEKLDQVIYVSATPADYELEKSGDVVEQIIRPTGLLDPIVNVRKKDGQVDYIIGEINKNIERNERALITTLTIRMAEELTAYLKEMGIKVAYLHSEIKSLERINIIRALRSGKFDCIVGINLLREGLDIPEVSKIFILDADKEGFLRNDTSLIQTIGRAARNANGEVTLFADEMTRSMQKAIDETARRREIQEKYNKEHGIVPTTIFKEIGEEIAIKYEDTSNKKKLSKQEKVNIVEKLEFEMKQAAASLDFEKAMELRDAMLELKGEL
ncbi:MAG: excinuclease ABC subunit UvrB [Bacilli bacterium]